MTDPLVSVLVRTKNRPDFLRGALDGLAAQEFRDFEAIVVNDGGEDVSEVIEPVREAARVRYVPVEKSVGRCAAGNLGIREARGKYVSWLDDDDLYYPNHLATLVELLERGEYHAAYTDAYEVRQRKRADGSYEAVSRELVLSNDFHPMRFFVDCPFHIVSFMHRKECVEKLGGLDEELDVLEDWDLFFRLAQDYTFRHIPVITGEYRIRDDGSQAITTMREEFARTRERLLQKYFHTMIPSLVSQFFANEERSRALEAATEENRREIARLGEEVRRLREQIAGLEEQGPKGRGGGLSSLFRPK